MLQHRATLIVPNVPMLTGNYTYVSSMTFTKCQLLFYVENDGLAGGCCTITSSEVTAT
jgi:hypothetical protein